MSTGLETDQKNALKRLFRKYAGSDLASLNIAVSDVVGQPGGYQSYYASNVGVIKALEIVFEEFSDFELCELARCFIDQKRAANPVPAWLGEFSKWYGDFGAVPKPIWSERENASSRARQAGIPRDLVALLDRKRQINDFREWVARRIASGESMAGLAVVCGCRGSAPHEAVDRMLSPSEGLRGNVSNAASFVRAQIEEGLAATRVGTSVVRAVSDKFDGVGYTIDSLRARLDAPGPTFSLLVVSVRIDETDLTEVNSSILVELLDACDALKTRTFPAVLAVASFRWEQPHDAGSLFARMKSLFWDRFDFRMRAVKPLVQSGRAIELLLEDVTRRDVKDWASQSEVKKSLDGVPDFAVTDKMLDEIFQGRPKMPLEEIADSLWTRLRV